MRRALVVGINTYPKLGNLPTPANDAEAIAARLEQNGRFTVKRLPDIETPGAIAVGQKTHVFKKELVEELKQLCTSSDDRIQALSRHAAQTGAVAAILTGRVGADNIADSHSDPPPVPNVQRHPDSLVNSFVSKDVATRFVPAELSPPKREYYRSLARVGLARSLGGHGRHWHAGGVLRRHHQRVRGQHRRHGHHCDFGHRRVQHVSAVRPEAHR